MGGSLLYSEIEELYQQYPQYKDMITTFVETGTYQGQTTRMASKYFKDVYTFEIVPELYQYSIAEGVKEGCTNIKYFLGDSVSHLEILMPSLTTPSMYFIDAHISGWDTSYNGKEYVPLLSEIDVILRHNKGPNIFILDDARFWVGDVNRPFDWAHITVDKVIELFRNHGVKVKDHFLRNDRYFILTE